MSNLTSTAALLPIASSARVRAVVGALLRQHPGRTTAVAVLFLAASALGIVMPACLGRIVDAVSSDAGFAIIAGWVAGAGLGAISAAVMMLWAVQVLTGLVQDMLASLREDVFASAMRLPVSSVDDGESADLLSRVTGDVDAVAEAGGNVAPTLLSAAFAIGVSVIALAALDPWLALAGIASAPFYVLGTRAFLRKSRVVFREVRVREAARSQAVLDAVEGIDTLTAFNEQEPALERVRERAEASIQMQIEGVRVTNRLFRWINGGELVGLAAILGTGFLLQSAGAITVGAVTTAALLFHRLFGPVGQLIFGLNDIQRAAIGLARLVGVIDLAPAASTVPGAGVDAAARASAGIEVRDLTFLYPTTGRGISGVNLQVDSGTTAALVGTSGSGKSTLARVIAGHHPPTSGSVHLASSDIAPYYLSQELHQFPRHDRRQPATGRSRGERSRDGRGPAGGRSPVGDRCDASRGDGRCGRGLIRWVRRAAGRGAHPAARGRQGVPRRPGCGDPRRGHRRCRTPPPGGRGSGDLRTAHGTDGSAHRTPAAAGRHRRADRRVRRWPGYAARHA
jgi:ABC-type multidrug transport system fused ATPase/permease subunit